MNSLSTPQTENYMDTIEYLASIFFDKLNIGDKFTINSYTYEVVKGRKSKDMVSKFNIKRTYKDSTKSIPIYEYYGSRFSANNKRHSECPFQKLVRDLEGLLIVDFVNLNNPLHSKSDVYNICHRP